MALIVHKYGGSSVATPEKIKAVASLIKDRREGGDQIVVVVSAMGKTTNGLIELAESVSEGRHCREMDMLLATGEQVSAALLSMALNDLGINAVSLNAFQLGIITTDSYSSARIKDIDTRRLLEELDHRGVVVVTGFQGITESGDLTTLGRGGSDTSAIAIATAIDGQCEIYSDVAGVFACDPRIVGDAKKLDYVTYEEMLEMSSLGAKVLHSRGVEIAGKYDIPIYCGSTFSSERGTYIVKNRPEWLEQPVVTGVAIDNDQMKISIFDIPSDLKLYTKLFNSLAENFINLDMITIYPENGSASVTFSVIKGDISQVRIAVNRALECIKGWRMTEEPDVAKVSAIGVGMQSVSGVAGRFFSALCKADIPILGTTTSEIKISVLVPRDKGNDCVMALMDEFELREGSEQC